MRTQMRIYVINRGQLDAFVAAWTAGVEPLRRTHGFDIPQVWINPARNEFLWVLAYDGPEPWDEKEANYYGSQERAALDPDPRQYIAQTTEWFIDPVTLPRST